ncbi:MAG: NACHT domain-containing protein [Flavipsychrobacter sp.]
METINSRHIPWQDIDWKKFETLVLYLAQEEISSLDLNIYLKEGNKQQGIDIREFNYETNKYLCIQCKYTKEIGRKTDREKIELIDEAIEKFLKGTFKDKSDKYILVANEDFQTEKIQNHIDVQKEKLNAERNIKFECWDIVRLEQQFKKYYRLVHKYFGKNVADNYCFLPRLTPQIHLPVNDFISRRVIRYNDSIKSYAFYFGQKDTQDIKEILLSDLLLTERICLVADAYQGKTSLLKQLAFELNSLEIPYRPIFIDVKQYSSRSIENILDTFFSYWKDVPYKDVIIIIDGIDEVPKDKFREVVAHVREFNILFAGVKTVISCRKLFYSHYNIYEGLDGYDVYELFPLSDKDVDIFLCTRLRDGKQAFYDYIEALRLSNFLNHPFYLNNLVELFKNSQLSALPQNVVEIFNYFIDQSLKKSTNRVLRSGNSLPHEKVKYRRCINELAFAMQILGVNAIGDEDVQTIFETDERELLENSSILSKRQDEWSFENAFFQENAAAVLLSKIPFSTIRDVVCVGNLHTKIKTKWIQTIASMFSYLRGDNEKYKELIDLIKNDNIYLITLADSSKFPKELKLKIFEEIINRCEQLSGKLRPINEETLGKFIYDIPEVVQILLDRLSSDANKNFKLTCWRIIYYLPVQGDGKKLLELGKKEIQSTVDARYAGNILKILHRHQLLKEKQFISTLMNLKELNHYNSFRNEIYQLLLANDMVDECYDYCLEGISFAMSNKNNNDKYYFSIKPLLNLLLATNDPKNIIKFMNNKNLFNWKDKYSYRDDEKGFFIEQLILKLIQLYKVDHLVLFSVINITEKLFKNFDRKEYTELEKFFTTTETNLIAFKLLLPKLTNYEWELSMLITDDCIPYLLEEIEDENLSQFAVSNFINGLTFWNKGNLAKTVDNFYSDLTGRSVYEVNTLWEEDENYRKRKLENDIKYIQSKDTFIDGIRKMFGKNINNKISFDELYEIYEDKMSPANSNLIFFLLQDLLTENNEIDLQFCSELVEKDFDYIRPYLIRYKADDIIKPKLTSFLEEYYNQNISRFTTEYLNENRLLVDIYRKYQFATNEETLTNMLYFDKGGIHNLENARLNKKIVLSQILLDNVEPTLLSGAILEHLKNGISDYNILGNHIGMCKTLKIREAAPIILNLLVDEKVEKYDRSAAMKIYLELGGEKSHLIPIFEKLEYSDEEFLFSLAIVLREDYKLNVEKKLLSFFNAVTINEESKIELANLLIAIGNSEAFNYIINYLQNNNRSPFDKMSANGISNVDVDFALERLKQVIHTALEYDDNIPHYLLAGSLVLDYINSLALKNEAHLLKVEQFLISSEKRLSKSYTNSHNLLVYLDHILEKFRENDERSYNIDDVKKLIVSTRS